MTRRTAPVAFVVAGDPAQCTGGYIYDARIVAELRALGQEVEVLGLAGRFPLADATARAAMAETLAARPDGTCVVIDGLALGLTGDIVADHAERLSLVALVHHPLADETGLAIDTAATFRRGEREALSVVQGVIVTSAFVAERLVEDYAVSRSRIAIVEPGVSPPAKANRPDAEPPLLLSVATLTPRKGHRLLVEALARITDRAWQCRLAGDITRDPDCVADIRAARAAHGLQARICLDGALSAALLDRLYRTAYAFVLPSFYEGYGMVVAEALAYGLPVVTTTGGALATTLPADAGLAVAPGDVAGLAAALARVLDDHEERARLAAGAARAGRALADWPAVGRRFASALDHICQSPAS